LRFFTIDGLRLWTGDEVCDLLRQFELGVTTRVVADVTRLSETVKNVPADKLMQGTKAKANTAIHDRDQDGVARDSLTSLQCVSRGDALTGAERPPAALDDRRSTPFSLSVSAVFGR